MNLQGKFAAYSRFSVDGKEIVFNGNNVTYSGTDLRTDSMVTYTLPYEMVKADYLLRNASCYEIRIKSDAFCGNPDFVYHIEKINGKDVEMISRMTMEYDGRGRIVGSSYVKEENLGLVDEDYESLLYQACNHRKSAPMTFQQVPGGMAAMGSMMGMNGMGLSADGQKATGPAWDCTCGEKGITGKFCPSCGLPRPS